MNLKKTIMLPVALFMALIALLSLQLVTSFASHAKAFCALRDPVVQIYQLFPQADNYRSVVRTVDNSVRERVINQLPNHQLHLDELGRHTLYIALDHGKPIGIVHVRSEQSRWGLIEIAWALDFNLTVLDFTFQRSRATGSEQLSRHGFKQLLTGKNFTALNQYLNADGQLVDDQFKQQAKSAHALSKVVLVNALKTLLVTQFVWSQEISQIKNEVKW